MNTNTPNKTRQAIEAIDVLNQINHIKNNLSSIEKHRATDNTHKTATDQMIDELNVDFHFKTIKRELRTLKAYAEYNLKQSGKEAKPSKYSAGHLVLD
tara:strand:- start:1285 stop:1578 length:294 start_codon:yes stop_codon:yes gene_type:complete